MRKTATTLGASLLVLILCARSLVMAQALTTAALNGVVMDRSGQQLPLANVVAVHAPTGSVYGISTREDGRYNLEGLKAGGPYTVTAKLVGYKAQTKDNVTLALGQNLKIDFFLMSEAVQLGEISVTAERNAIISSTRTGAATSVSADVISKLPTINRSFTEFQTLTPQFIGNSGAGRNNRLNNIQIDGANVNDLFGLGSTGTPGGQAGTTPISLDAIQEFQVLIAPYDVRQGGFTGGGINAITRSGSNEFTGSVFGYYRDQNMTGLSPVDPRVKVSAFDNIQLGFRTGGPIVKDKLFFFLNGEITRRNAPSDVKLKGSTAPGTNVSTIPADSAKWLQNLLLTKYGYDPGSYEPVNARRESNKLFARLDYNISDKNRLTVRHNFVDAFDDNLQRTTASYYFENSNYKLNSITNQTVAQLTSSISNEFANELIIGYTTIRDKRAYPGSRFPFVRINYQGNTANILGSGTENFSQANVLDQDILEVTDNFSYFAGSNIFTVGTHNEFFKFSNLFIRNLFGYYEFPSFASFRDADVVAGRATNYQLSYSLTGNPQQRAEFKALQYGLYAQVESHMLTNFTLTAGIRLDVPTLPDKPAYNRLVDSTFGGAFQTNRVPSGNILWSPRLGFNWDLFGTKTTQLRGGVGVFSGRVPYVWIGNQYANTGVEFGRLNVNNPNIRFSPDPDNQPKPGSAAGLSPVATSEIDLTAENFKMPQLLRFNAAIDQQLPFDLVGTVEFIYSKTMNDLIYADVNILPRDSAAWDGRQMMGRYSTGTRTTPNKVNSRDFTNVLLLNNTSQGYQWSITAQIQRPLVDGLSGSIAYTYGRSKDRNSVLSSQAYSQWRFNPVPGNSNDPPLTYSSFDRPHKVTGVLTYSHEFVQHWQTTFSLTYLGVSGEPFSYTYSGDINGDGETTNDLLYVPKSASDIILTTNNYAELDAYIQNDPYLRDNRGKILERSGGRNPWIGHVDFHIGQAIPLYEGHTFEVTIDVLNVLNLFSRTNGNEFFVANQNYSLLQYRGLDPATKRPTFSFARPTRGGVPVNEPWQYSDLASRWQAQIGIRYTF